MVLGLLAHVRPSIFFSRILRSEGLVYNWYLFQNSRSTEITLDSHTNHNYDKILKSDWLSTALISALIEQFNRTVRDITRALKWLFFSQLTNWKRSWNVLCFDFKKEPYTSPILLKLWVIGNKTSCRPIRSVIIPLIN